MKWCPHRCSEVHPRGWTIGLPVHELFRVALGYRAASVGQRRTEALVDHTEEGSPDRAVVPDDVHSVNASLELGRCETYCKAAWSLLDRRFYRGTLGSETIRGVVNLGAELSFRRLVSFLPPGKH